MDKEGTISSTAEELRIVWNNLTILSETLEKGKKMFVIHQINRIEKIIDRILENDC